MSALRPPLHVPRQVAARRPREAAGAAEAQGRQPERRLRQRRPDQPIETDDDNDLLTDDFESRYALDHCKADTDGDKVEDGYEYQSAKDLNDDEHQTPELLHPVSAEASVPERARHDGRRHGP